MATQRNPYDSTDTELDPWAGQDSGSMGIPQNNDMPNADGSGGFGGFDSGGPRIDNGAEGHPDTSSDYGSPWAPGYTPKPGEGDPQHNPNYGTAVNNNMMSDSDVEAQLREAARKAGVAYDNSDLQDVRHRDNSPEAIAMELRKYAQRASNTPGAGSGGSGGSRNSSGGGGYSANPPQNNNGGNQGDFTTNLMAQLQSMFPNGAFNQNAVNSQMSSVRDTLNQSKQQALANNKAYLADRGLSGSGPEATAYGNLESRINGQTNSAYQSIYGQESQNADQRMMQALQMATGLSQSQAQNAIDQFRANTEKDLGFGQLALGNKNADNNFTLGQGSLGLGNWNAQANYNLGQGNLNLGQNQLQQTSQYQHMQQIIDLLNSGMTLDQISANGWM